MNKIILLVVLISSPAFAVGKGNVVHLPNKCCAGLVPGCNTTNCNPGDPVFREASKLNGNTGTHGSGLATGKRQ